MSFPLRDCFPGEAALGGVIVGVASGLYMLTTGRVAGNSGAVKACLNISPDSTDHGQVMYAIGLLIAGAVTSRVMPYAYDPAPPLASSWLLHVVGGYLTGLGVSLCNGCTSGHGLSGLSRLSLRSLAAVPTFMGTAVVTGAIAHEMTVGLKVGPIAPLSPTPASHYAAAMPLILGAAALAVPNWFITGDEARKVYGGLWTGLTFGLGLAIGGMVRPTTVLEALGPQRFNLSVWILFMSGLATTFVLYRVAEAKGVKEARAAPGGAVDRALVLGSALFGIGWGLTGMCPGPLVVSFGAQPHGATAVTLVACLAGILTTRELALHTRLGAEACHLPPLGLKKE